MTVMPIGVLLLITMNIRSQHKSNVNDLQLHAGASAETKGFLLQESKDSQIT